LIFSAVAQASPFIPIAQLTTRSPVPAFFKSRTDAGRNTQELSLSPLRTGFQSSVATR
jgi:hypothetical protein